MKQDPRSHLCEVAAVAYQRRLLDSAGGNFSVRVNERIFCTPRYSGSRHRWNLEESMIVELDLLGNKLAGDGDISRELQMHLRIYREFPEAGGICHAHPINVLVFANLRRPIPPTSEQTQKYGTIELTEEQPAHSVMLAETVVDTLRRKREILAKHAIACLIPFHGITVAGRDLDDAYDALERIDGSCSVLVSRAAILAQHHAG